MLLAVIVAGLGVLRVWPPFAVVMSGSMTPTIKTGDMVVLMHLRGPARVGEVVEVPVPDDARTRYGYPPVVIHRVFRITGGQIRTKGDARPAADPFTVPQSAVQAKVVADIPAGGRILSFFHSAPGLLWLLFGAALFFGVPLLDRLRDARGREAEATADLRDQLAIVSAGLDHLQAEQERSRQTAEETLAQIDRLMHLVAQTLGRQRSAPGGDLAAPEATLRDTADPLASEPTTSAPGASVAAGVAAAASERRAGSTAEPVSEAPLDSVDAEGSAPAPAPARTVRSAVGPNPAAVTEPAPSPQMATARESALSTEPTDEVHARLEQQLESPLQPEAAGASALAAQPRLAPHPGPVTGERADPEPVQPAQGRDHASAASLLPGAQVVAGGSARAIACGRIRVPLPGPATDSSPGTATEPTRTCAPGLVARTGVVAGAAPASARPLPALTRWDAPPAASAVDGCGWAAPPVAVRSARFQRPGRLIAASLAQPSPVA